MHHALRRQRAHAAMRVSDSCTPATAVRPPPSYGLGSINPGMSKRGCSAHGAPPTASSGALDIPVK